MFEELGDKSSEATARGNLANRLCDLGRSAEALEQYEKAIAVDKEVGNRKELCLDTSDLATPYAALGNAGEASRLSEVRSRWPEHSATNLSRARRPQLGNLLRREGRFQDAITAYEEACAIADETNAIQGQMAARRGLAWASLAVGDIVRARTVAEDAAKYRYPSGYASALTLGGVVALRRGDAAAPSESVREGTRRGGDTIGRHNKGVLPAYSRALALAGLAPAAMPTSLRLPRRPTATRAPSAPLQESLWTN